MDIYHLVASVNGLAGIPINLAGQYMGTKSHAIQHTVGVRISSVIETCGAAMFLLGISSFLLGVVMSPLVNNN